MTSVASGDKIRGARWDYKAFSGPHNSPLVACDREYPDGDTSAAHVTFQHLIHLILAL